jgi:thiol-disulfide isomerase/thioredoxin
MEVTMNAWTLMLLTVTHVGADDTVLVEFSAPWCAPCRQMAPMIQQLETEGHPIRVVDAERDAQLAKTHHVQALPCFVMLVAGREVDREVGATTRQRLLEMLAKGRSGRHIVPTDFSPDAPPRPSLSGNSNLKLYAPGSGPVSVQRFGDQPVQGGHAIERKLLAATARLRVNDPVGHSFGTGTIIDAGEGEALIVTCAHIFRDSRGKGQIAVDLFCASGPRGLPGKLIGYDMERDVALVAIRPGVPVMPVKVAAVGYRPRRGERVISIGCSRGADPTVQYSRVNDIDRVVSPPTIQVAGQPVVGRSGGGLFNAEGQIIGVCYAADPQENQGLYAALSSIHAELDHRGLAFVYEKPAQSQPVGSRLGAARPPELPREFPANYPPLPEASSPSSEPAPAKFAASATLSPDEYMSLTPDERAALWAVNSGEGNVTCVVQMPGPNGLPREIVLKNVSGEFLQQLMRKRQEQESLLTSRRVGSTAPTSPAPPQVRPWAEW